MNILSVLNPDQLVMYYNGRDILQLLLRLLLRLLSSYNTTRVYHTAVVCVDNVREMKKKNQCNLQAELKLLVLVQAIEKKKLCRPSYRV